MLKLINTLEMFVQESLFYETTMLSWKRKSHWAVSKIIFRNRELTGTNASKCKAGTQCRVFPLPRSAAVLLAVHTPVL